MRWTKWATSQGMVWSWRGTRLGAQCMWETISRTRFGRAARGAVLGTLRSLTRRKVPFLVALRGARVRWLCKARWGRRAQRRRGNGGGAGSGAAGGAGAWGIRRGGGHGPGHGHAGSGGSLRRGGAAGGTRGVAQRSWPGWRTSSRRKQWTAKRRPAAPRPGARSAATAADL